MAGQSIWTGTHQVTLAFPPLWLEPGLYTLYFKLLVWGDANSSRYVSDVLHLDVAGESSGVSSVLHPYVNWTLTADQVDAPSLVLQ